MPHQGSCLCGKVSIEIGTTEKNQIVCHCTDCRQTSGSAFSTNVLVPKTEVKITGPVQSFDLKAPSGNIVTRVFCGNCGSAITHLTPAFGESQAVQTGNFKDFADIPIGMEIFVKSRWTGLGPVAGATQVQGMP
ncbi:unnamed protein product [Mycena citricolor]|uniref:CENP-V/GFA domain-containing protein n=1 Tax=Mycena citricolor TaxID=2018698 RepID=A0AAD2H605_9AGAR|nr:unnamed protein product [Mycena citricolor]CAK5283576.1 unnamed protein product [Mycena citricolor]